MRNSKTSKVISGNGISEQGGTLVDLETAYHYQTAFDIYYAGIYDTVLARIIHGDDAASDTYDENVVSITADGV